MAGNVFNSFTAAARFTRRLLLESEAVRKITGNVVAVYTDKATLPYVVYRRAGFFQDAVAGRPGPVTVTMEVTCYAVNESAALALAEAVARALNGVQASDADTGARLRSCRLVSAEEGVTADAYAQILKFELKV